MKDVVGYEGLYAIDEEGNVWSLNYRRTGKKKILKQSTIKNSGYKQVCLRKNGKQKVHNVHRLMALTYLSNFSEELDVDHIDRDKGNNSLSNLRMATRSENCFNTNARGYYWNKVSSSWQAYINVDGKRTHLGMFTCPVLARVAYLSAKSSLHTFTYDAGRIVSSSKKHE